MNQLSVKAGGRKTRRALRRQTFAEVTIIYMGLETPGLLRDLSTSGAAIEIKGSFRGMVGSSVRLTCDGLCTVEAHIRWFRNGRIGVEFDGCSNTAAKVHAYFKYYHREMLFQVA